MAYRFKRKEPPGQGVERIYREQLEKAATKLTLCEDPSEAIHAARKHLKKARSLVRLVRSGVGRKRYRRENHRLREAKQALAEARDSDALVETIDKLMQGMPRGVHGEFPFRHGLSPGEQGSGPGRDAVAGQCLELAQQLKAAPDRAEKSRLYDLGLDTALQGLEREYRRGAKAFDKAYAKRRAKDFHTWRKRVKDHWYHCRLYRNVWKRPMKARVEELKVLSDILGDEHDLSMLLQQLKRGHDLDPERARLLKCLAADKQERLREQARPLGLRLYAVPPECFAQEVRMAWRAWHAGN